MGIPYGLQLYTVRDHMAKNPDETLQRVKAIGYDNVELAGTAGLSDRDFKKLLDSAGLNATSTHVGIDEIRKGVDAAVAQAEVFGIKYIVIPHASAETKDGWLELADVMNRAGESLRRQGLRLAYHNHAHEFVQFDGQYALDILYSNTAPENLVAEIDTYWVQFGGADPVQMINKYSGRCPLLHVKDMAQGESRAFAEVGNGILDWNAIFAAAKAAKVQWYLVEQDTCPGDSLDSARVSARFMAAR